MAQAVILFGILAALTAAFGFSFPPVASGIVMKAEGDGGSGGDGDNSLPDNYDYDLPF